MSICLFKTLLIRKPNSKLVRKEISPSVEHACGELAYWSFEDLSIIFDQDKAFLLVCRKHHSNGRN